MRLLELISHGEFSLTKELINNIPPYAILSHTWGDDDQEVTFKDLTEGSGKTKAGYRKIRFCRERAACDGLQYFWIDTCCIDKSNNTELSEAINSMFRWYRNATKCYVYLSDVSTNDYNPINQCLLSWEPAFRKSRWFTRGWTLQELIAPASVEFFCSNGNRIGDRKSLERQLHEITGIAVQALRGATLSEFSITERMSWAETRETKREEDKAYSLLGIFDIHMPLIYGEGTKNACSRLREEIDKRSSSTQSDNLLNRLPYAAEAPFNSYQRQHEPNCLDNTRVDILREIQTWADGQDERCMFWLNGLAGTGKSTIARTVARRYFEKKRLGASFFFTRGGGDVGHAGKFVPSIVVQLASSVPGLHRYICEAITERTNIVSQSLRDQWHQLVFRPLSKLVGHNCHPSYVLVIDALDECDDNDNIRIILQLLAEARSLKKVRLRAFLASRPEIPIRYGICQIPDAERQDFVLHSISPSIVDHDISVFLGYSLKLIGQEDAQEPGWPGSEAIRRLVANASGLFIWAATACRFIREGLSAEERLRMLLEGSNIPATPEQHLNGIYITILRNSIQPSYIEQERQKLYGMLKELLGSIVILFSLLSVVSLSRLLHTTKLQVDRTLNYLHAILDIPKDPTRPIRLHHPSFRDFLLDKERCEDSNFWVDKAQAHQILAANCIRLMSDSLKQDICSLSTLGLLVTNVESSRVDERLPPEAQYACRYWVEHLQQSDIRLCDNGHVHVFLLTHFLHWLEALSLIRKMSEGVLMMKNLQSMVNPNENPELFFLVRDANRFILKNRSIIEKVPLQIYSSALVFSPRICRIRNQFLDKIPGWIKRIPIVEENWSPLLQALEGHSNSVSMVAFSPDGKLLASASDDHTVRLWDPATGTPRSILEGHLGPVLAVTFSPDGQLLASSSWDNTVRLWDPITGAPRSILEGHSNTVRAVAFSPDGQQLASGSSDCTVRLWDPVTGAPRGTLKGHLKSVLKVAFSPNRQLLISAATDGTVRLWDPATGTLCNTLEDDSDSVPRVAFSPDGHLLAFASHNGIIRLWDLATGTLGGTLEGHSDWISGVAFSPDSQVLASASNDCTVRVWDPVTRVSRGTLESRLGPVRGLAFSPDGQILAFTPDDCTIRLWDLATEAPRSTLECHSGSIWAMAFSPDSQLFASAFADGKIRLWDPMIRAPRAVFDRPSRSVFTMAFSPDGQLLASACGPTVRLWDPITGAVRNTLRGYSDLVCTVVFSPDGQLLACADTEGTVTLWDSTTGALRGTFEGHSYSVPRVAFSSDGQLLASVSECIVRLWDPATGALRGTFKGHSDWISVMTFSVDSQLFASASKYGIVRLWDPTTGASVGTFEGHSDWVSALTFSPDSQFLASASCDGIIRLWNLATGALESTLKGHSKWISAVAFSPDSQLFASASSDHTVKLWDIKTKETTQTLNTECTIGEFSFSSDGSYLKTNLGILELKRPAFGESRSQFNSIYPLYVRDQWVTWRTENILWLPPKCRARDVIIHQNILAIARESGQVTFIEIGLDAI